MENLTETETEITKRVASRHSKETELEGREKSKAVRLSRVPTLHSRRYRR